jgi:hypothetical protein
MTRNEWRVRQPNARARRAAVRYAAALLLLPVVTSAADWRHVEPTPDERLVPQYYRVGPDGALWSSSNDGVRRTAAGTTQLLHRSASGTGLPDDEVRDLVPLSDGGAVLNISANRSNTGVYCAAMRIATDGRVRWRVDMPTLDDTCLGVYANAVGQTWLFTSETLVPVDADGRAGAEVTLTGYPSGTRPVTVLADGSAVVATHLRGESTTRLARFDAQGRAMWNWIHQDQKPLAFTTPSGNDIVAIAVDDYGTAPDDVVRWNSEGQELSRYTLPARTRAADVIAADGGDVYVVLYVDSVDAKAVQRVSADGQLRWQSAFDCAVSLLVSKPIARTADDGLALACLGGTGSARLLRLSRTGALSSLPVPVQTPIQLVQQQNGPVLLLGVRQSAGAPPSRHTLVVDGTDVREAPLDSFRDATPSYLVGQQFLADGTAFIATAPTTVQSTTTSMTVTRLAPDGRVVWTRRTNESAYRLRHGLAAGGGLVCTALDTKAASTNIATGMDALACFDADTGASRWRVVFPNPTASLHALSIGADGKVRLLLSRSSGYELQRFDRDGNLESVVRNTGVVTRAVFDARGAATVATHLALRQYAPDGTPRMSVVQADSPIAFDLFDERFLASHEDGSVWLIGRPASGDRTQRRLWAVAPDGRTRWMRELGASLFFRMLVHGDALYAFGMRKDSTGSDRTVDMLVERIDAAAGTIRWTHRGRHAPMHVLRDSVPAISTDGREILLAYGEFDRLHLERVRTSDGSLAHQAFIACGRLCGVSAATQLDAAGTARVAIATLDQEHGQTGAVIATDLSAIPTRLDQPGITGAWWSPYANGEGILFDWLPASRTVFAAWFTYSTAGGNEPSELRWYTLQANGVGTGATTLELPILETVGGNFAAPPAVSPQRVGTANVTFSDCSNGTLDYAFDPGHNDARRGTITLTRLSPATAPCLLADGRSVPGSGARPPRNGFDARMSGTWFDEATPGQGLQLTVQPGGVFFAPWFTFDPAGAGNDTGRQHWFTLQGNLEQANNGSVELILVQTLGGSFDRVPTYNAYAVGAAMLVMLACDRARLDYRFDATAQAGPYASRSGSLSLSKAGGCTP